MKLSIFIRNSSRDMVVEGAKHIKRYYLPQEKLISKNNPLEKNIKSVKKHADATNSYSIKQNDINSFMAASSMSHMMDGWSYLSCSLDALLRGDQAASIHLAYYAELRSAMSILASEGIGVFNNKHIGVFPRNTNKEFPTNYYKGNPPNIKYVQPPSATHKFVWEAMQKWTDSAFRPHTNILEIFKVRGHNFKQLTEFFHPQATIILNNKIIKTWLKDWCFDIKAYKDDRENRNTSSYRPQRIKNFNDQLDYEEIISNISDFWNVLSPSQGNNFDLLDIYLLRKLYEKLYEYINPSEPIRELIENAFDGLGLHDTPLISFLSGEAPYEDDHLIFNKASEFEISPISIIARSILLLRISSGNTSQIFKNADISHSELSFVWENYGVDNGFWQAGSMPINFEDLWSDVEAHINDIKDRIDLVPKQNDLASILKDNAYDILFFKQINRACLWGVAI
ncbi:hypothetical protein OOZ15_17940 [Galbibacter sp. EGI 63066]|uniref:hypothetical protein n=1 Tax=Galbibacter sp. EGI 63066 TaxID=2993559 RepID=UPI00224951DA|nr:hypothetical protein [Galbibacter sp. EGI 63066]MCX2681841.1 hypothetical protein [Galbibacter sp. EGI 63066]